MSGVIAERGKGSGIGIVAVFSERRREAFEFFSGRRGRELIREMDLDFSSR